MNDDLDENILSDPVPVRYKMGILRRLEQAAERDGRNLSQLLRIIAADFLKINHVERRSVTNPDFKLLHPIMTTLNRIHGRINQIAKGVNYNAPELAELPATLQEVREASGAVLSFLSGKNIEAGNDDDKPDQYTPTPAPQANDDPEFAAILENTKKQMQEALRKGKP